jgi:hypothetical protein
MEEDGDGAKGLGELAHSATHIGAGARKGGA